MVVCNITQGRLAMWRGRDLTPRRRHVLLSMVNAVGGTGPAMDRWCQVAEVFVGVEGAGILVSTQGGQGACLGAGHDVIREILDHELTAGEGPATTTRQRNSEIAVPDLLTSTRWMAFTPAAVEAGIRALFSFPLRVNDVFIGALIIYRNRPGGSAATPVGRRTAASAIYRR